MANYDFKSLSSFDFEGLVRDLLQKQLGITLQSFKSGRDGGIDLRCSKDSVNSIVVQCKHYANSSFSNLLRHLENDEVPKLARLKPQTYVIATSLGLTPSNKDQIQVLFKPFCKSTDDVFGKDDINNLLGKFPEVERQNYKLWLTSTTVLHAILHSEIFNRTAFEVDAIQRKLKFYVQNQSFFDATRILEDLHYCIIAGIPGIGKTTLAEILLVDYLANGFEPVKILHHIGEAHRVFNTEKRQVFYYDDFLGQTTLEQKLEKNEDQDLLRFCSTIRKSSNHRFILTTREYILNQAKLTYEKLSHSHFDFKKCTIDLSSYSELDRAKILFNHIFFSDLPAQYKKELLTGKSYRKIIQHRNYSPRIVEWMTEHARVAAVTGGAYVQTFLSNLESPMEIWSHAFQYQIFEASRSLLLLLATLPRGITLENTQFAFDFFHQHRSERDNRATSQGDFLKALKELEGNFIQIEKSENRTTLEFHNPSIRDFVYNYLASSPAEIRALCSASVYFDQCSNLWNSGRKEIRLAIQQHQIEFLNSMLHCLSENIRAEGNSKTLGPPLESRVLLFQRVAEEIHSEDFIKAFPQVLKEVNSQLNRGMYRKQSALTLATSLIKSRFRNLPETRSFLVLLKRILSAKPNDLEDFEAVLTLRKLVPTIFSDADLEHIGTQFEKQHYDMVTNLVDSQELSGDVEDYRDKLEMVAEELSVDVSTAVDYIDDRVTELRLKEDDEDKDDEARYHAEILRGVGSQGLSTHQHESQRSSDNEIDSMFDSLAD